MSTNSYRGNQSSRLSRGPTRRSNTAPPPAVRIDPIQVLKVEPIPTTRSPGAQTPAAITVPQQPPAAVPATPTLSSRGAEPTREPPGRDMPRVAPPEPEVAKPAAPNEDRMERAFEAAEQRSEDGEAEDEEYDGSSPLRGSQSVASRGGVGTAGSKRKSRGSNAKPGVTGSTPPPAYDDAPGKVAEAPARREDVQASEAAREGGGKARAMHEGPMPAGPTGPASDLDERFFDHGEHAAAEAHAAQRDDGADMEGYDPRMERKLSPEARARRAKLRPYVWVATVACVGLAAFGLWKGRAARSEPFATPPIVVTTAAPAPAQASATVPKVEPSAPAPVAVPTPAAASASAEVVVIPVPSGEPAAEAPVGSAKFQEPVAALGVAAKIEGTDPASASQAPPQAGAEPTEADKKNAVKEKRSCQALLDQGAFAKAVEAGERSVALDPADGEAWLMLGAAYQSMGKGAEARRSFLSCVAEGKKGPIGECRAMLH